MTHLQSHHKAAEKAGETPGSRAFDETTADTGELALAFQPQSHTQPHNAHILSYGQLGKIAVSQFAARKSGAAALLNARTIPVLALIAEFLLVAAASFAAGDLYHRYFGRQLPYAEVYLAATLLLAAIFVIPCGLNRDYGLARLISPGDQWRSVLLHWNSAYLLLAFVLFITYATEFYSRGSIIAQYFAGFMVALGFRLLLGRLVRLGLSNGILGGKRILVAGDAASVTYIARRLHLNGRGIDVVGTVKLPATGDKKPGDLAEALREIGEATRAVIEIARKTDPDEIVISLPWSESSRIRAFVRGLAPVPATIHLAPDASAAWAHHLSPARVGPLPTIKLSRAPLSLRDRILKRCFDLAAGSMLLLVAMPIFAVIGLLIKWDSPGPVFFRQRRHGFNHGEFRIYKFRTMTTMDDGELIQQATKDDRRVTRLGSFLRRTNLDELPQLLNVLMGDMSLVGPRPHALAHNSQYEEKIRLYAKRHSVKPGITGWSQVNGYRGETETLDKMEKRVEFDIHYIDNWTLVLDIKILYWTLFSSKSFRNAY